MDLQPDEASDASPGHWVNRDWNEGSPGLFAVVIGVSNYRHLADGKAPAADTLDLGQLPVSALTAYQVFDWLRTMYRHDEAPLAECWILLSPTTTEIDIEAAVATHQTTPDLDVCKKALQSWRTRLATLPEPSARKSRALFFFSGHGLETHLHRQILLPADYLYPPGDNFNDAISPMNLHRSLLSTKVPNQFFFLDACRNDLPFLRARELRGQQLLPESEAALTNPDAVAPIFYATAPGMAAFAPTDPTSGLSLFGQALVDGLHGTDPIKVNMARASPSIDVYPLQEYMKAHIVRKLDELNEDVTQSVKLGGMNDNLPITFLDLPMSAGDAGDQPVFRGPIEDTDSIPHFEILHQPMSLPGAPSVGGHDPRVDWTTSPTRGPSEVTEGSMADDVNEALENNYRITRRPYADLDFLRSDFDFAHDAFGSEIITALWTQQLSIFALGKGDWIDEGRLTIQRVDRDFQNMRHRVFITIDDDESVGHWLQVGDFDGRYFGCVLPADRGQAVKYILEMRFKTKQPDGMFRLAGIESYLAADNDGPLGEVATILHYERIAHLGRAIEAYQQSDLRAALRDGEGDLSPLAAALIAGLLLRGNKLAELQKLGDEEAISWLDELNTRHRGLPDLAALEAGSLSRKAADLSPDSAIERNLASLNRAGLPFSNEAFTIASDQVITMIDRGVVGTELNEIADRFDRAMTHIQDSGVFAVYANVPSLCDPRELIGPWLIA